jgi:hypothetical protein
VNGERALRRFLQPSALEIRLELLLYEIRQRSVGRGAQLAE